MSVPTQRPPRGPNTSPQTTTTSFGGYTAPKPKATTKPTGPTQAQVNQWVAAGTPKPTGTPTPATSGPAVQDVPYSPAWTPDQLMSAADHNASVTTGLAAADSTLADKTTNLNYAKAQLVSQYKAAAGAAADSMAARGIFRSSISDAAQFDLTAQKAIQQQFLEDQLTNAQNTADSTKTAINNANADWLKAFNASATDANAGLHNTVVGFQPGQGHPTSTGTLRPGAAAQLTKQAAEVAAGKTKAAAQTNRKPSAPRGPNTSPQTTTSNLYRGK